MRCEWPEVGRCLCCLPLRYGLLTVGYSKLVVNSFAEFMLTGTFIYNYHYFTLFSVVMMLLLTIYLAFDFIFHIILIVGAHKKNHRTIRLYYRYSVTVFAISCLCFLGFIAYCVVMVAIHSEMFNFLMAYFAYFAIIIAGFQLLNLVFHLYLIILVRSEVKKLKNNQQFQFTNPTEFIGIENGNNEHMHKQTVLQTNSH